MSKVQPPLTSSKHWALATIEPTIIVVNSHENSRLNSSEELSLMSSHFPPVDSFHELSVFVYEPSLSQHIGCCVLELHNQEVEQFSKPVIKTLPGHAGHCPPIQVRALRNWTKSSSIC